MNIYEVNDLDLLKAWHSVEGAAHDHDFFALPVDPIDEFLPLLDGHQDPGQHETRYVGFDGDSPVASLLVSLPTRDNLTTANINGNIHPDHRGRGHGTSLVEYAKSAVRAAGRTKLFFEVPWNADGTESDFIHLLRAHGAKAVLDDVRRVLDLQAFPVGEPVPPPAGYRIVQWVDRAPDEVVDGTAYLLHRMVLDAPMGEMDIEAEKWDAVRYRASEESAMVRQRTKVNSVAVHEETGYVAGMSEVVVNTHRHEVANQWSTIVDPDHRGKRLGVVLKTWNHRNLVEHIDGVRYINTWNAESNSFMISVNEELGFRAAEKWSEMQLDLA